jgi:hypothetical protein
LLALAFDRLTGSEQDVLLHVEVSVLTAGEAMNGLIYLVGLVVVIMAILSFFGLH